MGGRHKLTALCEDCGVLCDGKRCQPCYFKMRRSKMKNCVHHPERKAKALNLCSACYQLDLLHRNTKYREDQSARNRAWQRDNIELRREWWAKYYQKNLQRLRERPKKKWAAMTADERWEFNLQRSYGLTTAQYYELLSSQEGCCAICSDRPQYRLYVDHDHSTRQIRGLLCKRCNWLVGALEMPNDATERARGYIEIHRLREDSILVPQRSEKRKRK